MSQPETGTGVLLRFIVDCMLGRLARWLRILGFDTWYFRDIPDPDLLDLHKSSGRILLTRDTRLVRTPGVGTCLLVHDDHWEAQLREVLDRLGVAIPEDRIMTRCPLCNDPLMRPPVDEVRGKVPDYVFSTHQEFRRCDRCRRIYWAGTHRARVLGVLRGLSRRGGRGTDG